MRTVDRILATSDLHGQNERFLNLLANAKYEPKKDLLVVCGDLIDRGEQNLDCLATCEALQKQGAILLKGNHEQFLEESVIEMLANDIWRIKPSAGLYNWIHHNGGFTMYNEIKDLSNEKLYKILQFVRGLPFYYEVGKFIFTHAGANTTKPIEGNTENETVWMDKAFPMRPAYHERVMVFGHIPTWKLYDYGKMTNKENAKIWFDPLHKDKICVDCGGIFGGRLAAVELPSYKEYYD